MAVKLVGVADTIIMKHDRWSGLTFMMYIHTLIALISSGLSAKMHTKVPSVNIGNISLPTIKKTSILLILSVSHYPIFLLLWHFASSRRSLDHGLLAMS